MSFFCESSLLFKSHVTDKYFAKNVDCCRVMRKLRLDSWGIQSRLCSKITCGGLPLNVVNFISQNLALQLNIAQTMRVCRHHGQEEALGSGRRSSHDIVWVWPKTRIVSVNNLTIRYSTDNNTPMAAFVSEMTLSQPDIIVTCP